MTNENAGTDPRGQLRVDDEMRVNEATLKLLQLEIESKVRERFFKSVMLPVGGGGILGIIVAVFLWIPQRVDNLLKQPDVQSLLNNKVKEQISAHFERKETQQDIKSRISAEVADRLPKEVEPQIKKYFDDPQNREFVQKVVQKAVKDHLASPEGQKIVKDLAHDYLKKEGKQILVQRIDAFLKPAVDRMGATFNDNRTRYVSEFEPRALKGEEKGGYDKLQAYLAKRNVDRLKKLGLPIVLTKTIRRGNQYVASVINDYLKGFRRAFGKQFKYVAISYATSRGTDRLLVLVPAEKFANVFAHNASEIVNLLNSANGSRPPTETQALHRLVGWFGKDVSHKLAANTRVEAVLRDPRIWSLTPSLDKEVAVVDAAGRLSAETSRRRIIEGLLDDKPLNVAVKR